MTNYIDRAIAINVMGVDLNPPLGYKMTKVGRALILIHEYEGRISLVDGTTIGQPCLDEIPQPEGTSAYADRAAWYVAKVVMAKDPSIKSQIAEVRYQAPPYSTSLALAWSIVDKVGNGGLMAFPSHGQDPRHIVYQAYLIHNAKKYLCQHEQAPMAICRAAMKMLDGRAK